MAGRRKAEVGADGSERFVRITEETLGLFRFFFQNEICQRFSGTFSEFFGQVRAADIQRTGNLLGFDCVGEMVLNVICHIRCESGRNSASVQPLHPFRIVQQHPVLQICNALRRSGQFALLDIGVAECKRIFHLHSALDCRA